VPSLGVSSQEHESEKGKSLDVIAHSQLDLPHFVPCAIAFTVRRRVPFNNGRWRISGQEMLALTNSVCMLGISSIRKVPITSAGVTARCCRRDLGTPTTPTELQHATHPVVVRCGNQPLSAIMHHRQGTSSSPWRSYRLQFCQAVLECIRL
jgi:hypothetical protein